MSRALRELILFFFFFSTAFSWPWKFGSLGFIPAGSADLHPSPVFPDFFLLNPAGFARQRPEYLGRSRCFPRLSLSNISISIENPQPEQRKEAFPPRFATKTSPSCGISAHPQLSGGNLLPAPIFGVKPVDFGAGPSARRFGLSFVVQGDAPGNIHGIHQKTIAFLSKRSCSGVGTEGAGIEGGILGIPGILGCFPPPPSCLFLLLLL